MQIALRVKRLLQKIVINTGTIPITGGQFSDSSVIGSVGCNGDESGLLNCSYNMSLIVMRQ